MMKTRLIAFVLGLMAASIGFAAAGEVLAQGSLKAISAFPKQLLFTKQFLKFVDQINKADGAPVKIRYVGGPEVTPVRQQGNAIRNGAFDMLMGPPAYYQGSVPEGFALFGANVSPTEARANGGTALLDRIFGEKLNAKFLAWGSGGVGFHIYLTRAPKRTASGGVDLSGFKLRSAPPYRAWFTSHGATNVMMQASEIYTGLERKLVDGFGWPAIGFTDLGLHKFVKFRIDPQVWQLDIVIIMNRDKWKSLSPAGRKFLTARAVAFEKESAAAFAQRSVEDRAKLKGAGGKLLNLKGAAGKKYVADAHAIPWKRIKKTAAGNYDALRAKFYK
jgi:TRAP-type C4-dicarboxylate transport system substrate-binding protein